MLKQGHLLVATSFLAVALIACDSKPVSPRPTPSPSQSTSAPTTSPTPSPTPVRALSARSIAYTLIARDTPPRSKVADIWLYDVATDRRRALTNDGLGGTNESLPQYHGKNVTFVSDQKRLTEMNLSTSIRQDILVADGTILAYEWSPDGKRVAYIAVNFERDSVHHLRIYTPATGKTDVEKLLGTPPGRGTSERDTVSIAWDRGGDRVLVNDTHLDGQATVRIISAANGADLLAPVKETTNAFWSGDQRSVYVRFNNPPSWKRIDLRDGSRRTFGLKASTFHAVLSPDGRRIAGVRGTSSPYGYSIVVFDLRTQKETLLATNYRDPIWLNSTTVAATRVERCSGNDTRCAESGWRGAGVDRITLSKIVSPIRLGTTTWEAIGDGAAGVRYA